MNHLRITKYAFNPDDHRPPREFWGPALRTILDPQDLDPEQDPSQLPPDECPICAAPKSNFLVNVYGWPICECKTCGVGFVWPQPTHELLTRFYGARYWDEYMGSEKPLYCREGLRSHIFQRQAQCFERINNGNYDARILDIGSGDGTMLRLLHDLGYRNISGIDLDAANVRRALELVDARVHACDFLSFQESGWDAITLWAVIEHLANPLMYLRHAHSLLKPGGLLILMTGDNESVQARIQGRLDTWIYPPEHLFYFTRSSLQYLFKRAGYENVRCRLQFQSEWKEGLLWLLRVVEAMKVRLRPAGKFWRSTNSNLLVAWGYKSNSQPS